MTGEALGPHEEWESLMDRAQQGQGLTEADLAVARDATFAAARIDAKDPERLSRLPEPRVERPETEIDLTMLENGEDGIEQPGDVDGV